MNASPARWHSCFPLFRFVKSQVLRTGTPNADLGSDGNLGGPVFVAGEGTPHALIIVPLGPHAGPDHAAGGKLSGGPQ